MSYSSSQDELNALQISKLKNNKHIARGDIGDENVEKSTMITGDNGL